jgi:hypothetical protein
VEPPESREVTREPIGDGRAVQTRAHGAMRLNDASPEPRLLLGLGVRSEARGRGSRRARYFGLYVALLAAHHFDQASESGPSSCPVNSAKDAAALRFTDSSLSSSMPTSRSTDRG